MQRKTMNLMRNFPFFVIILCLNGDKNKYVYKKGKENKTNDEINTCCPQNYTKQYIVQYTCTYHSIM